jgi:hypothetical protein
MTVRSSAVGPGGTASAACARMRARSSAGVISSSLCGGGGSEAQFGVSTCGLRLGSSATGNSRRRWRICFGRRALAPRRVCSAPTSCCTRFARKIESASSRICTAGPPRRSSATWRCAGPPRPGWRATSGARAGIAGRVQTAVPASSGVHREASVGRGGIAARGATAAAPGPHDRGQAVSGRGWDRSTPARFRRLVTLTGNLLMCRHFSRSRERRRLPPSSFLRALVWSQSGHAALLER